MLPSASPEPHRRDSRQYRDGWHIALASHGDILVLAGNDRLYYRLQLKAIISHTSLQA